MATLSELIQLVVRRLSQVPGTGVQIYAEDRIGDMIQHKFDVLFDERWWSTFQGITTATLDGSTGVVSSDLSTLIKRYVDIRYVYFGTNERPLPQLPSNLNPTIFSGSSGRFITPYNNAAKVFKVYPITAAGTVTIDYRTKPDDFAVDDEVPFDVQALVLGATYDYLEDDGANPGAIQKFQALFESRVQQLKMLEQQTPLSLDPFMNSTTDTWREM